jgi:hypothetical protein
VSLGLTPKQAGLWRTTVNFCQGRVAPDSIYGVLHRECFNLFPDEMFADLFTDVGRRSVPAMIVAVVMVLQRIEGLSDREAVQRFALNVADAELKAELRNLLGRDDDYTAAGKPVCDYDDAAAAGSAGGRTGPRRDGAGGGPGRVRAAARGGQGRCVGGHRGGPRPRPRRRRGVSHRAAGRRRSGALHRGPAGATRAQDLRARVRWL